jgi:peptide/nickel transport system substrate-binding protein
LGWLHEADLVKSQKFWFSPLMGLSICLTGCNQFRLQQQFPLVVASYGSIETIDPAQATSSNAIQLLSALGDTLYGISSKGKIEPKLALALPEVSNQGLKAVIKLRRNVIFHDGTPFNAEAMAFSLQRFMAIAKLSYVVGDRITAVKVIAPYELELTLRRPFSPLAALLSSTSLTPVSPTAYKQHKRSFLTGKFVGTGPYQLSFYNPQQQHLTPFKKYWGPQAKNNGIAMVGMGTSTTLFGALMGGDVDVLLSTSLEPDQQRALRQKAERGVLREGVGPALEIGYLSVLSDRPPLNNPNLRQALALTLDRSKISARVSDNIRAPLFGLVPPILAGAKAGWPQHDFAAAKKLLLQEGYCSGKDLSLNLTYRSNVPTDRLFALTWQELVRANLKDCLNLTVTGMESTTAYRQLGDGAFQMIMLDWSGDYPDPDNYLVPLLACKRSQAYRCLAGESAASGSFWTAPGLQKQLIQTEELHGPARLKALETVQERAALGVPYLPIWLVRPRAWARPPVNSPQFDGSGRLILADLTNQSGGMK